MSDSTLLSALIASLNANVFLREFSFARTLFTPPVGQRLPRRISRLAMVE